ncbi:hypothetical protein [Streptomyces canus]|uniref:hypothetical protein n=1 Tax=Streptomyces canus TaxID=58343 RepID=UPI002E36A5D4|nr:hypothetical protein [Streptomyces canus]
MHRYRRAGAPGVLRGTAWSGGERGGGSVEAVLRVVPVVGETTWSFVHRVAAAYGLDAADLTGEWRSANRPGMRGR